MAGRARFGDGASLLKRGRAAVRAELDGYRTELAAGRQLGALAAADLAGIARHQRPMEALRSLVSLGSADDPDAASNDPAANQRKAPRLTAQHPVLIAAYQAARLAHELPTPHPAPAAPP